MPIFTVTAPDGKKYTINGPEGSTQQDAILEVQRQLSTQPSTTPDTDNTVEALTQPTPEEDEKARIKQDTIEELKEDDFTYSDLKQNQEVQDAAIRFANNRWGEDSVAPEDAIDEMIEHFRSFDVNEITAGRDFGYVSGLKTDGKEAELNDYRLLFNAYNELPNLYEEGHAPGAFWDYLEGIATAPSTWIGALLPVSGGKIAGQAAVQASKLGIARLVGTMAANPIKTTIAVEGLGGVAQDVAAQNTLIEADIQKEYSEAQTGIAFALSAAPASLIPLFAKQKTVAWVERNTGNIIEESTEAIKKRTENGNKKVDTFLSGKKLDEKQTLFNNIATRLSTADETLRPLNEQLVAKGQTTLKGIQGSKNVYNEADINAPLKLSIEAQRFKNITGALSEFLYKNGGLQEGERITEGLARALRKQGATDEVADNFGEFLKKYNLTTDDVANVFMSEVSEAGRLLQTVGMEKKNFNKFMQDLDDIANYDLFGFDKQAVENIKKANKVAKDGSVRSSLGGGLKAVDQARLAFMTSQVGTTVRNTISGYSRIGFDVLTQTVNRGIQKATGTAPLTPNSDVFAIAYGLANRKESSAVRSIFQEGFGKEAGRLFRELADVQDVTNGKVSRLHGVSRQLNALNTLSDNMFKQAALTGSLKRQLNVMYSKALDAGAKIDGKLVTKENFDLIEIMRTGRFNDVFGTKDGKVALKQAVEDALEFTYQRSFQNDTARAFSNVVHAVPFIGTSFVPFPRFMMNAMKFTYEYSPFNMAMYREAFQVATGTGQREIGQSYEQVSKGMVGVAALAGATAFRMSELAGDRWYEARSTEGGTTDLRPMFPAAPYLFLGDLIARQIKGEPVMENRRTIQDGIQAISGAQFKAGMGLYMLENGLEDLTSGDTERVNKMIANFGANILSTFTIPATVLQDPYNTFISKDDERIIKDTNSDSMFNLIVNKTIARLPGNNALAEYLEDTLGKDIYKAPEPLEVASSGETIRRTTPLTRQTQGLLYRERRNELEAEMERLKILPSTLYKRTRDPEVDAINSVIISHGVQDVLIPYLKSKEYTDVGDYEGEGLSKSEIQRMLLKKKITEIKTEMKKQAKEYSETLKGTPLQRHEFEKLPDTIRTLAIAEYDGSVGKPDSEDNYNYTALLDIASKISSDVSTTQF